MLELFSSPIGWFLCVLVLTDIALLFIYVIQKNKAALYACLIILALLIGGATFLESSVVQSQQAPVLAPISAPVETPKSSVAQPVVTTPASKVTNEFSLSDLKVGLEVGGLKVASFGPFDAKYGPMAMDNIKVGFEGKITVSGTYSPSEEFSMLGVGSFSLDDASRQNFPKLTSDTLNDWFAFNGLDADVIAKLGKVQKQATIVIKNYTLQRYPSEVSSTADLVEVK